MDNDISFILIRGSGSGLSFNLLLLYLIRRFSPRELGTYKYLLGTFVVYDTYLVVVHHVTNPVFSLEDISEMKIFDLRKSFHLTLASEYFLIVISESSYAQKSPEKN